MPLARIYASLVEEAEPLRADLFARGYNVEVVFPDAELPDAADLELRLEHCSPEQAIARVEEDHGSPSRCVFLTPSRTRQHEFILIEMTVRPGGTEGRHPLYLPVHLPLVAKPELAENQDALMPVQATILPFPAAAENPPAPAEKRLRPIPGVPEAPKDIAKNDDDWDKLVSAEVTAFLANTPRTEVAELLPPRVLRGIRLSAVAARVRSHWEGLALLGVAAGLVLLLLVGWQAGPSRPWQPTAGMLRAAAATTVQQDVAGNVQKFAAKPEPDGPVALVSTPAPNAAAVATSIQTLGTLESPVAAHRFIPRERVAGESLIAKDTVVRVSRPAKKTSVLPKPVAAGLRIPLPYAVPTKSNPLQARSAPVKKITDLK